MLVFPLMVRPRKLLGRKNGPGTTHASCWMAPLIVASSRPRVNGACRPADAHVVFMVSPAARAFISVLPESCTYHTRKLSTPSSTAFAPIREWPALARVGQDACIAQIVRDGVESAPHCRPHFCRRPADCRPHSPIRSATTLQPPAFDPTAHLSDSDAGAKSCQSLSLVFVQPPVPAWSSILG
ncbi:hypothetical protein EV126DRAFT_74015 [Verticillium dahliae]|nr:hypothetical protein EV126DRAFT_247403 [Verticillium dahliae]KAH6696395.1 hypothetical protein EV126DRAFT_74015 [Verticillium dahliae]